MAKPRNNCFISSFVEALTLKKIFKSYVSEKNKSIKGSDKSNKNKYLGFYKRNNKSLRTDSFFDSVFAEDSIHNFVIKSVLGFIGGILLTYTCFMFFVFSLNFTLKRATLICIGLGVILSLGLAFSVKIRCTVFLCIPQLFSKRGRQALLAYAFILALSGPAKNTLHNVEVMSESLACGQEQIKQAENELVNCVQKPNTIAKKAIEKLLEKINPAVKFYKHFILQLYRTCFDILETFFSGQKWLSSIILQCNEKMGNPKERCENLLAESIENCKSTSTSPNWENLCNIDPKEVKRICFTKNDDICTNITDFYQVPIPRLKKRLNQFKRRAINVLYVRVEGQQTHIQPNRSNNFHEEYQGMATEIRQKTDQFLQYFDFMSVIFGIFILVLFVKVVIYRHKFLTEDHYDNRFITRDFEDIDNTRGEFNMETVLPLTRRERKKYIKVTSIRLIPSEKVRLMSSFIFLIFATFKIVIHMLTDSCLYWILSSVRRDERLLYMSTLREEPPSMAVKILGKGIVAALLRNVTKAVERQHNTPDLDPTPCLPDPVPPDYNRYYQIIALVLICWLLALFEPYGLRLRHTVMVTYHPDRARERAIWLHNSIMRNRSIYVEVARKKIRRKYRYTPEDSSLRFRLKKKKKSKKCLLCKEKIIGDNYYKCPTTNCIGIFCSECFAVLKFCSICRDAKEFEDLAYTSEEIDSSDEGIRDAKKKCKCSKMEKKIRKSKKNQIESYKEGHICLKIRKFYFFNEKKKATDPKDPHQPLLHQALKFLRNKVLRLKKKRKYISDQESSDWDFDGDISSSANEAENKSKDVDSHRKEPGKTFENDKDKRDIVEKDGLKATKSEEKIKIDENVEAKGEKVKRNVKVENKIEENKEAMLKIEGREITEQVRGSKEKIDKMEEKDKLKNSDKGEKRLDIFKKNKISADKAQEKNEIINKHEDTIKAEKTEIKKEKSEEKIKSIEANKEKLENIDSKESKSLKPTKSKWNISTIKEKYLNVGSRKEPKKVDKQTSISMFEKANDEGNENLPLKPETLEKNQNNKEEKEIKEETSQKEEKMPKRMLKLLKRDFQKGMNIHLPKNLHQYKPWRKLFHNPQNHPTFELHYQPQFNPQYDPHYQPQNPSSSQFQYEPQSQPHKYDAMSCPQCNSPFESQREPSQQPQHHSQFHPQGQKFFDEKDSNFLTKQTDKVDTEEEENESVRSSIMNESQATGYPLPLEKMIYMNFPELKDVDEYNCPARRRSKLQQTECIEIPSEEGSECLHGFLKKPQSQCLIPDEEFICIDPQKSFSGSGNKKTHVCTSDCKWCCSRHMDENFSCSSQTHICRRNASDSNLRLIDSSVIRRAPGCTSLDLEGRSKVGCTHGLDDYSNIRRTPGNINIEWKESSESIPYTLDCSKFRKNIDPCREFGLQINSSPSPKLNPLDYSKFRRSPEPCRNIYKESIPSTSDFSKYEKTGPFRNFDYGRVDKSSIFEQEKFSPESTSYLKDPLNMRSPRLYRNFDFKPPEPRSCDSLGCKNLRSFGVRGNLNLESDYKPELVSIPEHSGIFSPKKNNPESLSPLMRPFLRTKRSTGQVTFAPELSRSAEFYNTATDSSDDDYLLVKPKRKFFRLSSMSEPDENAIEIENLLSHSFGEKNPKKVSILKANLAQTYKQNLLEERDTENEDYNDTSDIDDVENTPDAEVFLSDKEFEKLSQSLLKDKENKEKTKPQLSWAPDLLSDLPSTSNPKDSHKSS